MEERINAAVRMRIIPQKYYKALTSIAMDVQLNGRHPIIYKQIFDRLLCICGIMMENDSHHFTGVALRPLTFIQMACFEVSKRVHMGLFAEIIESWMDTSVPPKTIHDICPEIKKLLAEFGIYVANGNLSICTEDEISQLREYSESISDTLLRALFMSDIDKITAVDITPQILTNNVIAMLERMFYDPVLVNILPAAARKVINYEDLIRKVL